MTAARFEDVRQAIIIHDLAALSGDKADLDVTLQMDAVETVLRGRGVAVTRLPADLDLGRFKRRLLGLRPDLVFNLVESLDRSDRLQTILPLLLEDWRIPFTGSGSLAMHLANDKLAAKAAMLDNGLPTAGCAWLDSHGRLAFLPENGGEAGDWIVKTVESHASLFLDDTSVLANADAAALRDALRKAERERGQPFFAERFIKGREFNISVVENNDGHPVVLPAAEISFAGLPPGRPGIVGYAAKWVEESTEYLATPRVFPSREKDGALIDELSDLSLWTWKLLRLAGYARVDFRVDEQGRPFILEANANPCLSPDAGLAAAAARGGLSFDDLVVRIAGAALRR